MKIQNVTQGSDEWALLRQNHHRTASSAAAMLGLSKYMKRSDLVKQAATGMREDNSDKEFLFAKGHAAEAAARPFAEEIVGEELFPATALDDNEYLLASFDGLTMMEDVCWEHKLINDELRKATAETLGEHYKIQMDQQMAVSGAEKCLYMASDGTRDDCVWFWYERDESRIETLLAGWEQFDKDVAAYTPAEAKKEVTGEVVASLPALFVDIEGGVKSTNLQTYQDAVIARIEAINTDLKTDQDFADAEAMVKFLDKGEKEIESVKKRALAQTESIEELWRTLDDLREQMRQKRLNLDKQVKAQKQALKLNIATAAKKSVDDHIAALNKGLGGNYLPAIATDFNAVMKGKQKLDSLQSAADDEAARAKIEASQVAEKIRANLQTIKDAGNDHLFPDTAQLVLKESDDLNAVIGHRIAEAKAAEDCRIAQEEARKQSEAQREESPAPSEPVTGREFAKTTPPSPLPSKSRPTDSDIISTLALHYRVHESKVIEWLIEMDLEQASEQLAANF